MMILQVDNEREEVKRSRKEEEHTGGCGGFPFQQQQVQQGPGFPLDLSPHNPPLHNPVLLNHTMGHSLPLQEKVSSHKNNFITKREHHKKSLRFFNVNIETRTLQQVLYNTHFETCILKRTFYNMHSTTLVLQMLEGKQDTVVNSSISVANSWATKWLYYRGVTTHPPTHPATHPATQPPTA